MGVLISVFWNGQNLIARAEVFGTAGEGSQFPWPDYVAITSGGKAAALHVRDQLRRRLDAVPLRLRHRRRDGRAHRRRLGCAIAVRPVPKFEVEVGAAAEPLQHAADGVGIVIVAVTTVIDRVLFRFCGPGAQAGAALGEAWGGWAAGPSLARKRGAFQRVPPWSPPQCSQADADGAANSRRASNVPGILKIQASANVKNPRSFLLPRVRYRMTGVVRPLALVFVVMRKFSDRVRSFNLLPDPPVRFCGRTRSVECF